MVFNFWKKREKRFPKVILLVGFYCVGKTKFGVVAEEELNYYGYEFYPEYTPYENEKRMNLHIGSHEENHL